MRQIHPTVALALAVGLAAGCSSAVRPEVLRAWVGRPAAALQQEWGPPTREVEDDALRILVYEQLEKGSTSDFRSPQGKFDRETYGRDAASDPYRSPAVYVRSYLFWVNRDGMIVHSAIRQP